MTSSSILVICPSHRDRRELPMLADRLGFRLLFHDYASTELEEMVAPSPKCVKVRPVHEEIERIVSKARGAGVAAVVSTDDYPGSTLAAIVASRLDLPATPPAADLLCQHKFQSRLIQLQAQPDAVPPFRLIEPGVVPDLPFPILVKPVKSFFSVGACQVDDVHALSEFGPRAILPDGFFEPLNALLETYAGVAASSSNVLGEVLLTGRQATFEGFAFEGSVRPIGVVDSILYPGTLAFERFDYPSVLPSLVQDRMLEIATRVMTAVGFTHGLFNMEFRYDAGTDVLGIVEINPRMASQFADLYEKVDGYSSYSVLLDLAFGRRPAIRHRSGPHAAASSCVLRRFDDALAVACPSTEELAAIHRVHPDARIEVLASPGELLSQQLQDECSFRYGIVNLGGRDRDEILASFDWCRRRLPFRFEDTAEAAQSAARACRA